MKYIQSVTAFVTARKSYWYIQNRGGCSGTAAVPVFPVACSPKRGFSPRVPPCFGCRPHEIHTQNKGGCSGTAVAPVLPEACSPKTGIFTSCPHVSAVEACFLYGLLSGVESVVIYVVGSKLERLLGCCVIGCCGGVGYTLGRGWGWRVYS